MKLKKYLSTALLCSSVLLGLTMVSANANADANNQTGQQQTNVSQPVKTQPKLVNQKQNVKVQPRKVNHYYNRRQKGSARIYQTHYRFTKGLNSKRARKIRRVYNKKIHYSRVAKTAHGLFYKTKKGWLNQRAFNQFLITHKTNHFHYRMRVIHNGNLYNLPAHTNNARKVATTHQLDLFHKWVNVNGVANTNTLTGYYRFGLQGKNYWILGKDLMFDYRALRGHHHRLEKALAAGERLIGHSKYNEKTRHYDCSSFLHHIFAKGGRYIGSSTYSQVSNGHRVNPRHLKRGDMIFFNTRYSEDAYGHKISGHNCHVAVYLGHGLILQDSPFSDNGGVDITSLRDPMWNSRSKYWEVHRFNGIARRIF